MRELSLDHLVSGLEQFSDRYQALDVFIQDVDELMRAADGEQVPGATQYVDSLVFSRNGRAYRLQVFPEHGVARLTRHEEQADGGAMAAGALLGGAIGNAIGAAASPAKGKAEGAAAAGLVLGLLVGAVLGAAVGADRPRRVFALTFDQRDQEWRAYDGGLIPWMKETLGAPPVLESVSHG